MNWLFQNQSGLRGPENRLLESRLYNEILEKQRQNPAYMALTERFADEYAKEYQVDDVDPSVLGAQTVANLILSEASKTKPIRYESDKLNLLASRVADYFRQKQQHFNLNALFEDIYNQGMRKVKSVD